MKYDDDELAEAALLVGLIEQDVPCARAPAMPPALEKKVLERAYAVASERRFSTTKAAAVSLENAHERFQPHADSPLRAWVGWVAAAACFAFAVYEWRVNAGRHAAETAAASASASSAPTRPPPLVAAFGAEHRRVAELRTVGDPSAAQLLVVQLPPSAPKEHYRVWLSPLDQTKAVPAGSFVCTEECRDAVFTLSSGDVARTQQLWITRSVSSDAWTLGTETIVAEGRSPGRPGGEL